MAGIKINEQELQTSLTFPPCCRVDYDPLFPLLTLLTLLLPCNIHLPCFIVRAPYVLAVTVSLDDLRCGKIEHVLHLYWRRTCRLLAAYILSIVFSTKSSPLAWPVTLAIAIGRSPELLNMRRTNLVNEAIVLPLFSQHLPACEVIFEQH